VPTRCSRCARAYGADTWGALNLVGRITSEQIGEFVTSWPQSEVIEVRSCACGQALARKAAPSEQRPVRNLEGRAFASGSGAEEVGPARRAPFEAPVAFERSAEKTMRPSTLPQPENAECGHVNEFREGCAPPEGRASPCLR